MVDQESEQNLPTGWAKVTVADVGEIRLGRQRSPDKHTGRFVTKYIRAANITGKGLDLADVLEMDFTPEEREVFRLKAGDIVLAEASGSGAHVGRPAVWSDEIPECCYQNTVIRFRPHAVEPEYALLVFRHYVSAGIFARTARGVGIQHLGASRFAKLDFPLPPTEEQKRIAAESARRFTEIENGSSSLQSALKNLDEQRRVIHAAAVSGRLVEQEAIIAKENGREFESAEVLLGVEGERSLGTASMFDDEEVDADVGVSIEGLALPEGWAWARIAEVGSIQPGLQRSPKKRGGRYPTKYLRSANITEDGLDLTDVIEMDFTPSERERYSLRFGDVLVVEASGSPYQVGRAVIWREEISECCYQNHIIRFRPIKILSEYAHLVFNHCRYTGVFAQVSRGMGIQHLGAARFAKVQIPLPPMAEQARIVTEAQRLLETSAMQIDAIRTSLDRLPMMESELFAAAVNGELVPQDPALEPAVALLARLGPPPKSRPNKRSRQGAEGDSTVKRSRMSHARTHQQIIPLTQVLREAGRPLTLPELFSMAGYDRDLPEHVERFYLSIRSEFGRSIRQVNDADENGMLEAITYASR